MPAFSVEEKMKIVMLGLDPQANIEGICRKFGITVSQFRDWKEIFLDGARIALARATKDRETQEIRRDLEKTRVQLKKFLDSQGK